MKLSDAIEGYLLDKSAARFSPDTIRIYKTYLPIMCRYLQDPEIENVTLQDLQKFFRYLKTEYVPRRTNKAPVPGDRLSDAAINNHWKAVRSLWRWAEEELNVNNVAQRLKEPPNEQPVVPPFTTEELKKLFSAIDYAWGERDGRKYRIRRPTAKRDKAIVYLLLDTGLRVGEACRLTVGDINLENGAVLVKPYGASIKSRPRLTYLGKNARKAMWMYLAEYKGEDDDSLFGMGDYSVRSILRHLGERAGVKDVHPHRFRHTFALFFLRNGGDVFSLRNLLGHRSLEMVQRYVELTQADYENIFKKVAPGDNLK